MEMGFAAHVTITRDHTGRLHVARCVRCGHLIGAGKSKKMLDVAISNHHCEVKSVPVRSQRS
jgi:hypothetical protein